MAEKQNLNQKVPDPLPACLHDSTTGTPDCLAIRFEVDSHTPLPQCARELLFNADMQEDSQGMDYE